jgi:plasmid maintenance system antidote protein VapI
MTDRDFVLFINQTLQSGVTIREMANLLSVTPPTVARWIEGQNLPYDYARDVVKGIIDGYYTK